MKRRVIAALAVVAACFVAGSALAADGINTADTSLTSAASGPVTLATTPPNDFFAGAVGLSGVSGSIAGSNVGATFESGEGAFCYPMCVGPTASVWYRWTAPSSGVVDVNALGASFPAMVGVYTGVEVASRVFVAESQAGGVRFKAIGGTTYSIRVDTKTAVTGPFTLSWELGPQVVANDDRATPTIISGVSDTITGTNSGASREADDLPHWTASVWYRWTAPVTGQMTFTLDGFRPELRVFRGTSFNPNFSMLSTESGTITFAAEKGSTYTLSVDGYPGGYATGNFTLNWVVIGVPTDVAASPGNQQAIVSFRAPASDGGVAISSYTVKASPGGATASGPVSPIVVPGLANGTTYTFTVTAANSVGTGLGSEPSAPVVPQAPVEHERPAPPSAERPTPPPAEQPRPSAPPDPPVAGPRPSVPVTETIGGRQADSSRPTGPGASPADTSPRLSSSPAVSSLENLKTNTRQHPMEAQAWRELATALEQQNELDEAITAIARYTQLKPKDAGAMQELGALYLRQADDAAKRYSVADKAKNDRAKKAAHAAFIASQTKAAVVYKKIVAFNPKHATNQFRLAQVARAANNKAEAVAAYTAFLKLAPKHSLAPAAKKALKELRAASHGE